jgi:transcription elongation factor SPT4
MQSTDDPELEDDLDQLPVVPLGDKKLRACLVTGLVKTEEQFLREGNDNLACLQMVGDRDMVHECTSAQFDGMVAMMKPHESWAARWQGIVNYVPGCYALRVRGTLKAEHIVTLEDAGIRYNPLDEEQAPAR